VRAVETSADVLAQGLLPLGKKMTWTHVRRRIHVRACHMRRRIHVYEYVVMRAGG
jgi:hypothetical protein